MDNNFDAKNSQPGVINFQLDNTDHIFRNHVKKAADF